MKKYKILIIVCIISIMCSACKKGIEVNNNYEETEEATNITTNVAESDKELSFSKLIMAVICYYPESKNSNMRYFLCLMNDGSVYTMNYELANVGSAYGSLINKLYACDENIWNEADDIKLIGKLSEDKVSLIKENYAKVNPDSDYYDRGKDAGAMIPDVVETVYFSAYCYTINMTKDKRAFCVKMWAGQTGCSHNTYDESANAILDIILEDQLYDVWKKQHISNLEDSLPDWEKE